MKNYLCRVARADGSRFTLQRTTISESVLVRDLNAEGFLILEIMETKTENPNIGKRLKPKSVLKLTEILATLTANGLTLKEALGLARPLGGRDLGSFLSVLDNKVQKGNSLHQALCEGPKGFSPLYLGLIRIGEQTGDLNGIFPRLVDYLKSRQSLKAKTVSALAYPLFVMVVAFSGLILLSVFVLPMLTQTISGFNPEVAFAYQQNVDSFRLSALVISILLFVAFVGTALSLKLSATSPRFALQLDRLALRVPLLRSYLWQSCCLHLAFSLEILLSSGFTLEAAMEECTSVIPNKAIRASWTRVRAQVVKGSKLSQALKKEAGFPEVFLSWIEVGESAHDLKRSFQQLRTFYQNQMDVISVRFANLAEPVLIVLVGGVVILLVLTFITPIFSMLGRLY